jgi:ABC-type glycerol-3-phosphate transport system substrate-binding protein
MALSDGSLSRRTLLRLASAAAAGGAASAILAACGGAPASPTAAPAKPAESKPAATTAPAAPAKSSAAVTVRFTTWWQPLEQYIAQAKQMFEAKNPNITINTEFIAGTEFVQKMEASLVANTWGDASICNNGVQVKFMEAGYHYDMTDATKADGINLQADWSLMGLEIWQGRVLHLPFDNDPRAIYYNKTAFKEAGVKDPWDDLKGNWTWDDMIEAAKKTTKKEGDKIVRYGLQWNYTSYQEFSPLVWTLGGNYANWKTLKYTLDDPKVLEVHKMLYKWANEDKFLMTKEAQSNLMGPQGGVPFRAGITAMYHRAAYEFNPTKEAVGTKFEWDVAPLPNKDANTPGVPVTSGNPNFVPKATKNAEAGYKWIAFLASQETQDLFAKTKVLVPSNKKSWKLYQQPTDDKRHPESFIKWVYGRPHGFHFYNAGMSKAGTAIDAELDLAYLGKQTIEQALQNAQKKANEAVDFGSAKDPFAFTVPKPPEPDLKKWGIE